MNDAINSPGQPRPPETPAIGAGDGNIGVTLPATEHVKPMTMGRYAQKVSFNKGDYFSHDNKLYYKSPEGKVSHVTGAPEGDRELKPREAIRLVSQKSTGDAPPETAASSDGTSGPRPAPTPRKKPEIHSGDVEPGTNPMNPPYAPESEAVRGTDGESLSPEMKERVRGRLKNTPFENMDLDSLKLYRGKTPWYMHPERGGITLENHIYMGDAGFNPENNPNHFDILVEEAVHAGQFQYGDMTRAGYLLKSLPNGYIGNPHEDQAWRIAYPNGIPHGFTPSEAANLRDIRNKKAR